VGGDAVITLSRCDVGGHHVAVDMRAAPWPFASHVVGIGVQKRSRAVQSFTRASGSQRPEAISDELGPKLTSGVEKHLVDGVSVRAKLGDQGVGERR
jgi:hypothetical protein